MSDRMKPLLTALAFCAGAVFVPWLVFVVINLIGPVFVFGCVLFLGWCLGRRPDKQRPNRLTELRRRQMKPSERMQERLFLMVHARED